MKNNKSKKHFRNSRKNQKTKRNHKNIGGKDKNDNFKKMNCSPMVKDKTPVKDSCLPEDILLKIKNSYNEHHIDNPIKKTDFNEIWQELKQNLDCNKEDCWLKELNDKQMRKNIDKMIFAPDQPPEWKHNPDEWLSNYDILDVLKQYEKTYKNFKFIGPTPIDFDSRPIDMSGYCVWEELCNFSLKELLDDNKRQIGIIFNLDKHDQDGSHWVSLFIDLDDKFIFYFDSAGDIVPNEISVLIDRIIKQGKELDNQIIFDYKKENKPLEHQRGNTECGMYSLYFIITMLSGETNNKKFSNYKEKIAYFTKHRIPDKFVFNYRNHFFNSGGSITITE